MEVFEGEGVQVDEHPSFECFMLLLQGYSLKGFCY